MSRHLVGRDVWDPRPSRFFGTAVLVAESLKHSTGRCAAVFPSDFDPYKHVLRIWIPFATQLLCPTFRRANPRHP